jgi:hypothetical protein
MRAALLGGEGRLPDQRDARRAPGETFPLYRVGETGRRRGLTVCDFAEHDPRGYISVTQGGPPPR